CQGLASKIDPLLSAETPGDDFARPDAAIFYSISNCQPGLRGISFGNLLIKQVVEELRAELPGLKRFATLSPIPRFRCWLNQQVAANGESAVLPEERMSISNQASAGNDKSPTTFLDMDRDKAEHLDGAL